jgi:hypothetical protein
MMRLRFRTCILSAVFALATAGQAFAAEISQFSWSVTGGTFGGSGGNFATGAITSGSVVYTPPGGSVATPAGLITGGSAAISLVGTLGSFSAVVNAGGAGASIGAPSMFLFTSFPIDTAVPGFSAGTAGSGSINSAWVFGGGCGISGFICVQGYNSMSASFVHRLQLGVEVRTVVPEPATGTMLGLGLLGIGMATRARGAAARWRRTSRG